MSGVIRVVIVDDSPFTCQLLTTYLETVPDVRVVGNARHGTQAIALIHALRPDVVTLDLAPPGMGGLAVLDHLMHACPTPVVLVSGVSRQAAVLTLKAIHMGAVDFVLKYTPGLNTDVEALRTEIIGKVRTAARVRVIRSVRLRHTPAPAVPVKAGAGAVSPDCIESVVVVGASTGGPAALREMLQGLPADFPGVLLIVQHMPGTFTTVLAAHLDRAVRLSVCEAQEGNQLLPGTAFIAPGDYHLLLGTDACVHLSKGPKVGGHRPAIDVTMQAVAHLYGTRTRGVVLTGMGADGAMGLLAVHARGGLTFAQDAASCVVDSMPQRAMATGIVDYVGTPAQIAQHLRKTASQWRRVKR